MQLARSMLDRVRGVGYVVWLTATAFFGSVVMWAAPAGAAGVIEVKDLVESVEKEITANLPAVLGLVGVLLAIGVILAIVRRHAKPS